MTNIRTSLTMSSMILRFV